MPPGDWFDFDTAYKVIMAIVAGYILFFRTGHAVGSERAQVKIQLEACQKLIDTAGQRMSDRIKGLQQLVTSIEIIKQRFEALERDQEKLAEDAKQLTQIFVSIRERIASCEARLERRVRPR